jgi:uncharacterized membrane protein YeiB
VVVNDPQLTRVVPVEHLTPTTHRRERLVGPDVVRAVALIGVVVMNYHGYLNGSGAVAGPDASFLDRLFDPWTGVLSTRFAATFMLVAGVGISLLTERSRTSGDREAIRDDRWRLVRRGLLLYGGGFLLDWVWPGTILFFYGATFVVAALLFTLRTRWLVVVGATSALAAAAINAWVIDRTLDGRPVDWLTSPGTLTTESPRGLLLDTFVNGTHPLLPWMAFCCAGMVLGRVLPTGRRLATVGIAGAAVTLITYLVNHVVTNGRAGDVAWIEAWSTRPFDRGLLYTLGTLGSSLAAYALVSWLAERYRDHAAVRTLGAAGEMTLTLYLGHVAVYLLLVDVLDVVGRNGLTTALLFALAYWTLALAFAAWWRRFIGMGPAERLYRRLGG